MQTLKQHMLERHPEYFRAPDGDGEHLPAPAVDLKASKGRLLAVLSGNDPLIAGRAAADALAARNRALLDAGSDEIRAAVADQIVLLEATVERFTLEALRTKHPDRQKACANIALKAHTTLTQALACLHRMTEDQRNGKAFNG